MDHSRGQCAARPHKRPVLWRRVPFHITASVRFLVAPIVRVSILRQVLSESRPLVLHNSDANGFLSMAWALLCGSGPQEGGLRPPCDSAPMGAQHYYDAGGYAQNPSKRIEAKDGPDGLPDHPAPQACDNTGQNANQQVSGHRSAFPKFSGKHEIRRPSN